MAYKLLRRSAPVSVVLLLSSSRILVKDHCIELGSFFCIVRRECSRLMVGFHQKAATGKLTGVHRKYSTSKFAYTSKCEPAKFLLQTQL